MMKKVMWLVIVTMVVWSGNLWAAPGDLDTSFSTDGMVVTDFSGDVDYGRSVAIQGNGKIVVAGRADNGTSRDFAVARYDADGALDTGFGGGDGMVVTDFGSFAEGWSVAIQGNGKIVVAGYASNGSNEDFAVARYNVDGTLDTGFGTGGDGKVVTDFGNGNDCGQSVAIQADGRIVVAGYASDGANDDFAVARYNVDGTLDTGFGTGGDGKVVTDFGGDAEGWSVAIQGNGKIVVAGYASNGSDEDFAVARYDADGALDTGFGTGGDGKVVTDFGSYDYGESVAIQGDGRIVVAGYVENGSDEDFAVARYDADGALDTSFSGDGMVTTAFGNSYDEGWSVAIQADGRIVVAGMAPNGSNYDFAVARYDADGALDTGFGTGGMVTTDFASNDEGYSVAIQGDGKIVVAGMAYNGSNGDFAVARYEGDPPVPADVASVPTLAEWGLIILSLLLAGCACIALSRKKEMTV